MGDPFLNQTKKRAVKILAINSDVNQELQIGESKLILMPAVATNDMLFCQNYVMKVSILFPSEGFCA